MTKIKKILLVSGGGLALVLGIAWAVHSHRDRPVKIDWARTLEEATARSRPHGKLIIADIYTDWCGWCKEMDVKTWGHPAVIEQGEKYVFLKLNAETEADGIALQRKFGIVSYPTVLLLDSGAEEFERLEGYLPAEQFLARLSATLEDPDSLGNLRSRERREPQNPELRLKVGKKLYSRQAFEDAQARFEQVLQLDPENRSLTCDSALMYLGLCQASLSKADASLATLARLRESYPQSRLAANAHLLSGEILLRAGRRDEARSRIEQFLRIYPDHPLKNQALKLLSEL